MKNCILTGLPIENQTDYSDILSYDIRLPEKLTLTFCRHCLNKFDDLENFRHLVIGILINKKFKNIEDKIIAWDNSCTQTRGKLFYFKEEFENAECPRNTIQLKQNLLKSLVEELSDETNFLKWSEEVSKSFHKYFFRNTNQLKTYLDGLANDGLLLYSSGVGGYYLTLNGLLEYDKFMDSSYEKSKKCFVAMRFVEETKSIREAIRFAIRKTGFEEIFIDEVHHEPESTINDAMIARMKESKFCIADFTQQNRGVYFESGYMMGRGKKVIFTCSKDDFDSKASLDKKSHFDTNHFPHIVYETTEQLKDSLVDKIKAWIV